MAKLKFGDTGSCPAMYKIQEFIGIPREVDSNGNYIKPASNFVFSLPSNITGLGDSALQSAFMNCNTLVKVDLSSITRISGQNALYNAFQYCYNLTSVDFSAVTTISGSAAFYNAFSGCSKLTSISFPALTTADNGGLKSICSSLTTLTSINFPSLTTIYGNGTCSSAFSGCTGLTSISFPSLTTLNGYDIFGSSFSRCSNLSNASFPMLTAIDNCQSAFTYTFQNCTKLENIYFNALKTTSFGSTYNNQFDGMLNSSGTSVTHTIHFPSNLESTISTLRGYPNFGGTSGYVTLSFDLPATS